MGILIHIIQNNASWYSFNKIHFAVILYVLGNACYIFNSSNKFFLQIHFTRIIYMHFFKNNVSSFSFRHKFLNTLKNIDIEINVFFLFCFFVVFFL